MHMVSSRQIRAARALLGWSAQVLASESGVGSATIKRYEVQDGVPNGNTAVLLSIQQCLENAGIKFIGDPSIDPGVVLQLSSVDKLN